MMKNRILKREKNVSQQTENKTGEKMGEMCV